MAFQTSSWTICCVLFTLVHPVFSLLNPIQYCLYACNSVTFELVFDGSYDSCVNENIYNTVAYCAAIYCTEAEINAAFDVFSCPGSPSFDSIIGSADLSTVSRISYMEALSTANKPLTHAVVPDPAFYEIAYNSVVSL